MPYRNLIPITGVILNIATENDCCSQMISLRTEDGIVNFLVDADTKVIDDVRLRMGMRIAAFYDGSQPIPLIFPPRYRARLITVVGRNEQVMISRFDQNLLAENGSLQLNIAGSTVIRTANGQQFSCRLGNRTLLVYYTATTRSIPPQTTPSRVIVFCENRR